MTLVPGSQFTHFSYNPNVPANALYIAIFCGCLIAQIAQGLRYQTWQFSGPILVGILFEIFGYIARILMHQNPSDRSYFLLNNITLILGPAFLSASIYLCMGNLVRVYGAHISALKPRFYLILFVAFDLINLSHQGIGGGISSTRQTPEGIQAGLNIVIAGLSTQVASLLLFMLCCLQFSIMVTKHRDQRLRQFCHLTTTQSFHSFLYSLGFATICIFVRSLFRVIELRQGFTGRLANNELYFMTLEGAMILLATLAITIFHPGRCFQGYWNDKANTETAGPFPSSKDRSQTFTMLVEDTIDKN